MSSIPSSSLPLISDNYNIRISFMSIDIGLFMKLHALQINIDLPVESVYVYYVRFEVSRGEKRH